MIENTKPREQNGRDSFERYRIQAKAAALESLKILDDNKIDKVYCDFHDDYVVRLNYGDTVQYLFYQVKTKSKKNAQWKIGDLMGLNTKNHSYSSDDCGKFKDSFVGKLLYHTVLFNGTCHNVIFQTNIHTTDELEDIVLAAENNNFTSKYLSFLVENFNKIYEEELVSNVSDADIKENIKKLRFATDVEHLKSDANYSMLAREKIYEYSEVDLSRIESSEILRKLIELVETKSEGVIKQITPESIETLACISINDLLSVLSLSKAAYLQLKESGDNRIIKSISKIQRLFKGQNINDDIIEFCSRAKVNWDDWVRNNRHEIVGLDFIEINEKVNGIVNVFNNKTSVITVAEIRKEIKVVIARLKKDNLLFNLNEELILGGFFAELIKREQ